MRHHITGINKCPGCTSTNETIEHMLKCPHPTIKEKREEILSQMLVKGKQKNIPKGVLTAFIQLLTKYTTGATDYTTNTHSHTIQDAITQQMAIGVNMMARGYIGKEWIDTVPTARHPTCIMNKLQRMVWMDFFEPLWQNRNKLLYQQKNNYGKAENAALTEKLVWYHQHTLLAHHDHFLLHNIDMSTLHTMPSRHKQEWIRHLTAAKLANTQELALKKTNQHSLFRYMKPVNAPPTANPGTLPPREKLNNPNQQGGKTPNRRKHSTNNTNISQTTDTLPPQENATKGADTKDESAAAGGTSGLARSDTPGRVFPHLPRQQRNSQVLHQSPKHTGPHSKDMRQRVPCRLGPKPHKTIMRRQWVFQDFRWKPHQPYAYGIRRHTRGTQDETMAETQLGTPMHPQPD